MMRKRSAVRLGRDHQNSKPRTGKWLHLEKRDHLIGLKDAVFQAQVGFLLFSHHPAGG